jgi:hypothetical protein
MLIHLVVFSGIGFFSGQWGLLLLFVGVLAGCFSLWWIFRLYACRDPEKKRLHFFPNRFKRYPSRRKNRTP